MLPLERSPCPISVRLAITFLGSLDQSHPKGRSQGPRQNALVSHAVSGSVAAPFFPGTTSEIMDKTAGSR